MLEYSRSLFIHTISATLVTPCICPVPPLACVREGTSLLGLTVGLWLSWHNLLGIDFQANGTVFSLEPMLHAFGSGSSSLWISVSPNLKMMVLLSA